MRPWESAVAPIVPCVSFLVGEIQWVFQWAFTASFWICPQKSSWCMPVLLRRLQKTQRLLGKWLRYEVCLQAIGSSYQSNCLVGGENSYVMADCGDIHLSEALNKGFATPTRPFSLEGHPPRRHAALKFLFDLVNCLTIRNLDWVFDSVLT